MDDFEARKREVLQPILFEAGAALLDCQSFEYGISYLLFLFARLGTQGLPVDRAESILNDEEKKTAGQLVALLKQHVRVSPTIEQELTSALKARNHLVHRYLIENIERMVNPLEHEKLVKEIRDLRTQVRKSSKQLDPFVKSLAEHLDGVSPAELEAEMKTKFLADTKRH
jgi:hypothetical protein